MNKFSLSDLKISNQNVFRYSNNPERYISALEIADEIFCNFVIPKVYKKFDIEILSLLEKERSIHVSERRDIYSCKCDVLDFISSNHLDEKNITYDDFEKKIHGFENIFNLFVDIVNRKLSSIGLSFDKEEYLVDSQYIKNTCLRYGESEIYGIEKKYQSSLIEKCAFDVSRYFAFICLAEEVFELEGEDISPNLKSFIDTSLQSWEYSFSSTQFPRLGDYPLNYLHKEYIDICHKHEVSAKDLFSFYNIYPKNIDEILNNYQRNETDFSKIEVTYDNLTEVFYHFLIHGYYPPVFCLERFFSEDGKICSREVFFEDRKEIDILELNVGRIFDIFEYKDEQLDSIAPNNEQLFVESSKDINYLFSLIKQIKNLIEEHKDSPYIPSCDIIRVSQCILNIEKEISTSFSENEGRMPMLFFERLCEQLLNIEKNNRLAFLTYKEKYDSSTGELEFSNSVDNEDFDNKIDISVAEMCETLVALDEEIFNSSGALDEEIFNSSGVDISKNMDIKVNGMKNIIDKKYLLDLRQIRSFIADNSGDKELVILIRDAQKLLDIASKAYEHDECLQSSFDWFKENEPKVIDAVEYFCHLKKVPATYKVL